MDEQPITVSMSCIHANIRRDLGWIPEIPLEQTLRDLPEWWTHRLFPNGSNILRTGITAAARCIGIANYPEN